MWCPLGFVPVSALMEQCRTKFTQQEHQRWLRQAEEFNRIKSPEEILADTDFLERLEQSNSIRPLEQRITISDILEFNEEDRKSSPPRSLYHKSDFYDAAPADYVESGLLTALRDNLFIAPLTGEVRKIDGHLFAAYSTSYHFTVRDIYRVARDNGITSYAIDDHLTRRARLFPDHPDDYWKDYQQLQKEEPSLDPWRLFEDGGDGSDIAYTHQQIPFFHERVGYTISLQGFDLTRSMKGPTIYVALELAGLLRPAEGWALCTLEAYAASEDYQLALTQALNEHHPDQRRLPAKRRVGRPLKPRDRIIAAYMKLCPNGIRELPWKSLAARIAEDIGETIDEKTLRSILAEADIKSAG